MSGDGTNDAPALAQADIGLVMDSGTMPAKEAGNMLDLDNDPAKIVTVISIGRQVWVTRLALFAFSVSASLVQCLLVVPAMLRLVYPELNRLNILHIQTPHTAVLSAVICNAVLVLLLLPVALRGVPYHPSPMANFQRRNLLLYLAAGLLVPFPVIWLADRFLALLHVL